MNKPEVTWVQSLDHCEDEKHYYFKEHFMDRGFKVCVYEVFPSVDGLQFVGDEKIYHDNALFVDYEDKWQISIEPVPMPEVER
jgi:hypothetical protein